MLTAIENKLEEWFLPFTSIENLKDSAKKLGYEISEESHEKGITSFYGYMPKTFAKYIMFFILEKEKKAYIIANLSPEPSEIMLAIATDGNKDLLSEFKDYVNNHVFSIARTNLSDGGYPVTRFNRTKSRYIHFSKIENIYDIELTNESEYREKLLLPIGLLENTFRLSNFNKSISIGKLLFISLKRFFISSYGEVKPLSQVSEKKKKKIAEDTIIDFLKRSLFYKTIEWAYTSNSGHKYVKNVNIKDNMENTDWNIELFVSQYLQKQVIGKYSYSSDDLYQLFEKYIEKSFFNIVEDIFTNLPKHDRKIFRGETNIAMFGHYSNEKNKMVISESSEKQKTIFKNEFIKLATISLDSKEQCFVSIKEHNAFISELYPPRIDIDDEEDFFETEIPF